MMRRVAGAAGGVGIGIVIALACAGSAEQTADGAGPSTSDGGLATFVTHAMKGEYVPPDLDDVEHMCALLTGCDKLPIPTNYIPPDFPSCVKRYTEELTSVGGINASLTMRECALQANSCSSLRTCALRGANPDACSGRGKQGPVGFCDVDGRALTCVQNQIVSVRDCSRGKEECLVRDGQATCTLGPCGADIKDGDKPRCSGSGTHLLHCEKGKLASYDCAAFGLKCQTAADRVAVALMGIDIKKMGYLNYCAAAGLACSPTPGGTTIGACVSPPLAIGGCDSTQTPRCDGANIRYCVAGKPRSHFCKATGFNKCDSSHNGPHCAF